MISQLKPDIYRCIARHLSTPSHVAPHHDAAQKTIKLCQQDMLNMMKSSKLLYDIFAPELYARCSIGNLSSLLTGFEYGNPMIDNIRHLHLYSGEYSEEPTYTDFLLRDLWSGLGPPRGHTTTFAACEEVEQCLQVGIHIRHAIARAEQPLKMLRSVSLGGYGDLGWSSSKGQVMEKEMIDCFGTDNAKGIPQILLGLESVDHFCQSVEYGPLALSPKIFQPLTPLKVFTYHLRAPDHTHALAQEATPIVIGAINRYYYAASFTVNDDGMKVWSRWPRERQELLGVLIETFKFRKTVVLTSNMTHSGSVGIDTVSLDNTIIELYDYIRKVEGTEEDRDPFIIVRVLSPRLSTRPAT